MEADVEEPHRRELIRSLLPDHHDAPAGVDLIDPTVAEPHPLSHEVACLLGPAAENSDGSPAGLLHYPHEAHLFPPGQPRLHTHIRAHILHPGPERVPPAPRKVLQGAVGERSTFHGHRVQHGLAGLRQEPAVRSGQAPEKPRRPSPREIRELGSCLLDLHEAALAADRSRRETSAMETMASDDSAIAGPFPVGLRPQPGPPGPEADPPGGQEIIVVTDTENPKGSSDTPQPGGI